MRAPPRISLAFSLPLPGKNQETMRILNPLYDTIFKFMMEKPETARAFIGTILDTKVEALAPMPREVAMGLGDWRVLRLDYKAVIRGEDGKRKTVIIEVQKYDSNDPVARFRKYLASNYSAEESALAPDGQSSPLPVVPIYILGYRIPGVNARAFRVDRKVVNLVTGEEIAGVQSDFIELLTHQMYVLVVTEDTRPREALTRLERLLNLFEQRAKGAAKNETLEIDPTGYDDELMLIVERLREAAMDEALVEQMAFEQEVLEKLVKYEQVSGIMDRLEREKAEAEREKAEAVERERIAERERAEAVEREKQLAITLARKMLKYGESVESIAQETGLSEAEVRRL